VGAAAAAGIPFTVSIFISGLALPAGLVDVATIGVLSAAVMSGGLALAIFVGRRNGGDA
jgi:Na+/H+ antiporter NhaA